MERGPQAPHPSRQEGREGGAVQPGPHLCQRLRPQTRLRQSDQMVLQGGRAGHAGGPGEPRRILLRRHRGRQGSREGLRTLPEGGGQRIRPRAAPCGHDVRERTARRQGSRPGLVMVPLSCRPGSPAGMPGTCEDVRRGDGCEEVGGGRPRLS